MQTRGKRGINMCIRNIQTTRFNLLDLSGDSVKMPFIYGGQQCMAVLTGNSEVLLGRRMDRAWRNKGRGGSRGRLWRLGFGLEIKQRIYRSRGRTHKKVDGHKGSDQAGRIHCHGTSIVYALFARTFLERWAHLRWTWEMVSAQGCRRSLREPTSEGRGRGI